MKRKTYILIFILICCKDLFAQDFTTSQVYNVRLLQNPAFAGYEEGNNRVGVLHRAQYITPGTYNINAFTFDKRFCQPKKFGIGIGAYAIREEQGDGFLKTMHAGIILGIHKKLNESYNLSVGLQFGPIQQSIDWSKLVFSDQIDFSGIDNNKVSAAAATNPNIGLIGFDLSAGILFKYKQRNGNGPFIMGLSTFHISNPNIGLVNYQQLPMRTNLHIGKTWEKLSINRLSDFSITGRWMQQNDFIYQTVDLNLSATYHKVLTGGIGIRDFANERISKNMLFILMSVGVGKDFYKKSYWKCMINYDINVGGLVGPIGILELSIVGNINNKCAKSGNIACPNF